MVVPKWLVVMYKTIFFRTCVVHPNSKKNDLDHFCTDCLRPLCSNCLPAHMSHKHVKIRRYIYSDVINRQDLSKLFNCSGIQTYHTNKAKVVFLKQRRQQQQQQNNTKEYKCIICYRSLQDNSRYCSIACKVSAIRGDDNCKRRITNSQKDGELKYCFQNGNEEYIALPCPKKQKLRRKGTPLRAPMF